MGLPGTSRRLPPLDMRTILALHAFPPGERTGVESYSEALAGALARAGIEVEVFAPRRDASRAHLSQLREERDGYAVTWLGLAGDAEDPAARRAIPGVPRAFARFLDREQPDLVHFQHLYKLGAGLIDVARERGLPVVYTAHDPFPVCNDYTLLAPDLSPIEPGDLAFQARCELARGLLDDALDQHDGFLPVEEGESELAERVHRVLHGEAVAASELEARTARIAEELAGRLAALSRVDRVEAPTRFLAGLLEAGGLRGEVAVRPCGIECGPFAHLPPPRTDPAAPLRVLYLGGFYEHKGAHVLLDACAGLRDRVELTLRGCAGSSDYAARLEQRARSIGARFGGSFGRDELPALLGDSDLVVLPSLWPENAPFVIREAFAAGRPVIASDTPALRESVRDGVDGLLVPAGDAQALGALLAELAGDRGRFAELARGVRAPRSLEEDAGELAEIYAERVEAAEARRRRRRTRLPEHLQPFAARHEALQREPTRVLVARALEGLERLGGRLGWGTDARSLLAASLAGEGRLRERFAEARRAEAWREEQVKSRDAALAALEARVRGLEQHAEHLASRGTWLEQQLDERDAKLAWKDETLADRRRALDEALARLAGSARTQAHLEHRLADLERAVEALSAEREWLESERRSTRGSLEESEARHAEARSALHDAAVSLGAALAAGESLSGELEKTRDDHRALADHERWLRGELARVLAPLCGEESGELADVEQIAPLVSRALARLRALADQLDWRADEMRVAAAESHALGQRLTGGALRRRARSWEGPR